MTVSRTEWLDRLADLLGVVAPTAEEVEDLLSLAGSAAHSSERTAAPISCWLVAKSGVTAAQARVLAEQLAVELTTDDVADAADARAGEERR
jgi:hypothetical protein